MIERCVIRLPKNVPARWRARFTAGCRRDTEISFRRVWHAIDGPYAVLASQWRYGKPHLLWAAMSLNDRGCLEFLHLPGPNRFQRTARAAFAEVIQALKGKTTYLRHHAIKLPI